MSLQRSVGNSAVSRLVRSSGASGGGVPVQRAGRAPAPERLGEYADAMADPDKREGMSARRSGALTTFGRPLPGRDQMYDMDETTPDYEEHPTHPTSKAPLSGGHFHNLYGRDGQGSVAVMMENYRAPQEKYTASEAFIHQWSQAVALFEKTVGKSDGQLKKLATKALQESTGPADVPDKLPDSIFRQNISGEEAKEALGRLMPEGKDDLEFTAGDATYDQILTTVNGKSTKNIVSTFNELKRHAGGNGSFRITGGGLRRDASGNFQLRFDVGE
ncbi:hypothetical protein [Streptomyces sp. NPDC048644]|uniref:hypothetical protein n=1 Tax=Streptomyces sp. NPDC048644 TaxID=3365582 RepID=UPI00370F8DAC